MSEKTFTEKEVNAARIVARRGVPDLKDLITLPEPQMVAKKFLEDTDFNFDMLNTAHEYAFSVVMAARLHDALHGHKLPVNSTAVAWAYATALSEVLGVEF